MPPFFSKLYMVYPWDSQVVMSLPHFLLDGYNFQNCENFSFNYTQTYADLLQCNYIGKHAHLFFRHQSTVRLTFNICHAILAV